MFSFQKQQFQNGFRLFCAGVDPAVAAFWIKSQSCKKRDRPVCVELPDNLPEKLRIRSPVTGRILCQICQIALPVAAREQFPPGFIIPFKHCDMCTAFCRPDRCHKTRCTGTDDEDFFLRHKLLL